MTDPIAFSVAVGDEQLATKTKYLVRSIRKFYPDAPVLTFLTETERPRIDPDLVAFFERETTLRTGPFPKREYPISAKVRAYELAADAFDAEYYVQLDSDVVLVDSFAPFLETTEDAEVYAKPVDYSDEWTTEREWREVVAATDYEMPWRRTVSTVDKCRIRPFYNAGVVITTEDSFPGDWLDLTLDVHDAATRGAALFSDQVALGLLSQDYRFREASELENYPLINYEELPRDAIVVHYHEYEAFRKVVDEDVIQLLVEFGVNEQL